MSDWKLVKISILRDKIRNLYDSMPTEERQAQRETISQMEETLKQLKIQFTPTTEYTLASIQNDIKNLVELADAIKS